MNRASRPDDGTTRRLLQLGMAAGPLYIAVGLVHALTREGFDMRRHALSLLSIGDFGWIQVSNFVVTGGLVLAGAVGVRRRLHHEDPMVSFYLAVAWIWVWHTGLLARLHGDDGV